MKHVDVRKSRIAGFGLFAAEPVRRGEQVCRIKGTLKFKVNRTKKDALANPDWVGVAKNQWIDPAKPYKFLNHSCDPNTAIKGRVTIIALRDIKQGEEITIDYSIIEGDPRWEMQCQCGSKMCRSIIRSIHYLPEKQYKKYYPYIAHHFKNLYSKRPSAESSSMVSL